jgi:hypothetical protein
MEVAMSSSLRFVSLAAALLALPSLGAAQSQPIELGLDAALDYRVNSPHVTTIGVPFQDLRVGIGINDRISIEPRLSFNYLKLESVDAVWTVSLGGGLLFHLNEVRRGVYVRPFVTWNHIDGGGSSASQFAAGGGVGIKTGTGRVIGRFEAAYAHAFKNDNFVASDDVMLLLGFSVFTK